jgi:hypothetical protein
MRMRNVAALVAALIFASPSGMAETDAALSPAQHLLFASDHLHTITTPAVLRYSFAVTGEGGFVDGVAIGIDPRPDGTKDVRIDFLGGERHLPFAPVSGFKGNPVLMFFLERDVIEMHRATGGSALYFRNRIREAFADRATMRPVQVAIGGREQEGTEVTLLPFREDPMIARFAAYREKSYRFVLVDAVPGTIYQIRTQVPAGDASAAASETTMTFSGTDACHGSDGCAPAPPSP